MENREGNGRLTKREIGRETGREIERE